MTAKVPLSPLREGGHVSQKGAVMNYSRTVRDGSARDAALKRRNSAVREGLGMESKPKPETEKPVEQKSEEKPSE
jgi:hypothetical protein